MFKIQDRVLLAILTGSVSAQIANLFGYLSKLIYEPTVVMPEAVIEIFTRLSHVETPLGIILGNLWSYMVGGLHAVAYLLVLDLTGWRYLWLKSLAVTSMGWIMGVGVLFRWLGLASAHLRDIHSLAFFFLAHLVYASVSALIAGRVGVPKKKAVM